MKSGLSLDVVVRQCAAFFKHISRVNQALLLSWHFCLALDHGLDLADVISRFDFQSYGFACQGLDEDLNQVGLDQRLERLLGSVPGYHTEWVGLR